VRFALAATDQGGAISSGMGAVMGSKNLKAVVVKGSQKVNVASPDTLKEVNKRIRTLRKGLNESVYMTEPFLEGIEKVKPTPCYGCPAGCMRAVFRHVSGLVEVRKTCAAAFCYLPFDTPYHGHPTETPFIATSYCDRFGLDTGEFTNLIVWLKKCFERGLLSEAETGLPLSKIGSREFLDAYVDMVVNRKGFGDLLAQGTRRASIQRGTDSEKAALERITPSGYNNDAYGARVFLITALFYATEPRNPIIQLHEVNFLLLKWALWHTTAGAMSPITTDDLRKISKRVWGSEAAVDFSTYEGKALAAVTIQNRQHAKEALVACDRYFPILDTDQKDDHMGDPTFEPSLFSAVTGREMSESDYLKLGERSFNAQRAIYAREGIAGRSFDILSEFNFSEPVEKSDGVFGMFNPDLELPGKGAELVVRKGLTLDRAAFENMKDDYYTARGWDVATGLQKRSKLEELGLNSICPEMEKLGLLK
jgi:aldehyde:ferredoxin oxidoreductase